MNRRVPFLALVAMFFLAACGEQPEPTVVTTPATESTLTDEQVIQEIDQLLSTTERIRTRLDMAIAESQNN